MSTKKTDTAVAAFTVDADVVVADDNAINSTEVVAVDPMVEQVNVWAGEVKAGTDKIAAARDNLAVFANETLGAEWWDLVSIKAKDVDDMFVGTNEKGRWDQVDRFKKTVTKAVKDADILYSNATALFNSICEAAYKLHKVNVHNLAYAASVQSAVAEGKAPPAYAAPAEVELNYSKRHEVNAPDVTVEEKALIAFGIEFEKYQAILKRSYRLNMKLQDLVEKAGRPADPRLTDTNVQLHDALTVCGVDPSSLNV